MKRAALISMHEVQCRCLSIQARARGLNSHTANPEQPHSKP
ncbi:hypothetical protein J2S03_001992 [Alicyclobacillus cycloheptanicus]|uniref:Uncharacterized protein n=1 Tax=Alicyclobacillus cycloheptanicus TaxID=1457 RepID=A0ABT9XJA9_9BACL|nr:hypothetical protein [Alicyclobacillus cycloheptanicus]